MTTQNITPENLVKLALAENKSIAARKAGYLASVKSFFPVGVIPSDFSLIEAVKAYMRPALGEEWPSGYGRVKEGKHKSIYTAFQRALADYKAEIGAPITSRPRTPNATPEAPTKVLDSPSKAFEAAIKAVDTLPSKSFNAYAKSMVSKLIQIADEELLAELADFIEDARDAMGKKAVKK